jgi:hypothetical protein
VDEDSAVLVVDELGVDEPSPEEPSSRDVSHDTMLLSEDRSESTNVLEDDGVEVGPSVTAGDEVAGINVIGVDDAMLLNSSGNAEESSDIRS